MRNTFTIIAGTVVFGAVAMAIVYWLLLPPHLPVPQQQSQVISGVTVINPGEKRLEDQSIVVVDGRIEAIRQRRPNDPVALCEGCFAVPGLIDAHVHNPPTIAVGNQQLFALLYLAHGVTSVRDVGQSEASIATMARKLNDGKMVGPHMYRCGPIIESPPTSWPLARVVTSAEEGAGVVGALAEEGVDCIKVYNELTRDAFMAIASAAKEKGLPLIGHVPHAVRINEVSDFESQHFTGVPYLRRPRPALGMDIRDEDVQSMAPSDIDEVFGISRNNRISFTPTLANFSLRLVASDSKRFPPTEGSRYLPAYWAGAWDLIAGHPGSEAAIAQRLATQPLMRALASKARRAGVDVLAGTDTLMPWVVPGEALHLEIAALAQAFGDNEAALEAATRINGDHIAPGTIGVLKAGTRADILLLTQDPVSDLNALRDWHMVIAKGRLYERAVMDKWLQRYRDHFRSGLYESLMGTIVGWAVGDYSHVDSEG